MSVDTSSEAVERRATYLDMHGTESAIADANLLRALAQERDAARAEVERLTERVAWLEQIREGAGRALCVVDAIEPDEPISDGGHVAWELHVYQRAHAALALTAAAPRAMAEEEPT